MTFPCSENEVPQLVEADVVEDAGEKGGGCLVLHFDSGVTHLVLSFLGFDEPCILRRKMYKSRSGKTAPKSSHTISEEFG